MPGTPALSAADSPPELSGLLATGEQFDLAALRPRWVLIEFHRGTW